MQTYPEVDSIQETWSKQIWKEEGGVQVTHGCLRGLDDTLELGSQKEGRMLGERGVCVCALGL